MAEPAIIETRGLTKRYDGVVEALAGMDLTVPAGSICGFLGRNGAGKTTTIKTLLGMVRPTGGEARVFGLDAGDPGASLEIRRRAAFVDEEKDLYPNLSVAEMLAFTARFFPRWRTDLATAYVARFGLPPERAAKALSRGMRTKLSLVLALSRGAELLILDEPTSGLDPEAAEDVLQALVSHCAKEAVSIFFSSHQLAEVEQVADRVVIIDRGRSVVAGPLDELQEGYRRIRLIFEGSAPQVDFRSTGVVRAVTSGRSIEILANRAGDDLMAEARALNPASVDTSPLTLKDIFLQAVRGED